MPGFLSFKISQSLLKLEFFESMMPFHPLSYPSHAFNLFQHQGLIQLVGSLHQVAKYWSFSFSISPSNEYAGLISFRIDWYDLLAVQGTLKSLLQHHSLKASFLWCSAFFTVQRCFLKIIYFLAVLGLCYCESFSLAVASSGYSLVAVSRLLIVGASVVAEYEL